MKGHISDCGHLLAGLANGDLKYSYYLLCTADFMRISSNLYLYSIYPKYLDTWVNAQNYQSPEFLKL